MAQEKRIEARKRVFEMLFEREFRTDETPEEIFDHPKHERLKEFLAKVL